jgi:flagellar protein FliO/FliZ
MEDISVISLFMRLFLAMGFVLLLMWLAARAFRNRGVTPPGRGRKPLPIELLARQGVGQRSQVAVVRTVGKILVLGVTEANVTLLADLDPDEVDFDGSEADWTAPPGSPDGTTGPSSSGSTWKAMIDAAREKTVRRS